MTDEDGWVPVANFPGYSVNPLGQVRNDATRRVLHVRINQYGVPYVGLTRNHKQVIRSLPRLVAETFAPSENEVFDTPINLNGDRADCRVDNLAWRPRWYAIRYVNQFDDRYDHPIDEPIVDADTDEEYRDSLDAACQNGLLEREVVLSILNHTLTWPTFQKFAVAI
jgi:hypothetical protein